MTLGSIAASALQTFSIDMQVRAHNIANVNTNGFISQDTAFMTSSRDMGVEVASIFNTYAPSSPQPSAISLNENGRQAYVAGALEGNNLDLGHEFIRMTASQRAFEANAAVIRTHDDISGTFLDLKV